MFIYNPKSCHVLIGHMVTAVTVTVFAKSLGRPFCYMKCEMLCFRSSTDALLHAQTWPFVMRKAINGIAKGHLL
jgi:hypothetical protein